MFKPRFILNLKVSDGTTTTNSKQISIRPPKTGITKAMTAAFLTAYNAVYDLSSGAINYSYYENATYVDEPAL